MLKKDFKKLPSVEILKEYFYYDSEDGSLYNLKNRGKNKKGSEAETLTSDGYLNIFIGKAYRAHRIIWKMVTGKEPKLLDHINKNRSDNRFENLREASVSLNIFNTDRYKNELSRGIRKHGNKFRARISFEGKRIHLGLFKTLEEAVEAYNNKARELYHV